MSSGDVRTEIRRRYAAAARVVLGGLGPTWSSTPSPDPLSLFLEEGPRFGSCHYSAAELATIPAAAVRASLGCGSPTTGAPLAAGQIVLDIGCGGGIDSILAAKMVEPDGLVIGLDISAEMVELARRNAAAALTRNAFFVTGLMEELPIANQLTDVVIGNSAINLSTAKERTLSELFRVLAPGGRPTLSTLLPTTVCRLPIGWLAWSTRTPPQDCSRSRNTTTPCGTQTSPKSALRHITRLPIA